MTSRGPQVCRINKLVRVFELRHLLKHLLDAFRVRVHFQRLLWQLLMAMLQGGRRGRSELVGRRHHGLGTGCAGGTLGWARCLAAMGHTQAPASCRIALNSLGSLAVSRQV